MMRLEKTLAILREQQLAHEHQLLLVNNFVADLGRVSVSGIVPVWMKFQVHIQLSDSGRLAAVMSEGQILSTTYEKAVTLWIERNGETNRLHMCPAEVFVCINDHFIAMYPIDAVCIANSEGEKGFSVDQFWLDKRLIGDIEKTVWRTDEELPGYHASKPTEELLLQDAVASPS